MVKPSGLFRSEAILARRLFCAMPIEHVSPVSSRMQRLMSCASASVAGSSAVASRYASSMPTSCMIGENRRRMSLIRRETRLYSW